MAAIGSVGESVFVSAQLTATKLFFSLAAAVNLSYIVKLLFNLPSEMILKIV